MRTQHVDFNGADALLAGDYADEWATVQAALDDLPVHLKASDQAGIQGNLIFDPVGTNAAIKDRLQPAGWAPNVPMPKRFDFLGTDVDFVRRGAVIEVQFSNYPFLLNNTVRGELLHKSGTDLGGAPVECLVVVTKAHMFPASNSTLYYEQGVKQLTELASNRVFDIPVRLVGLFTDVGEVDCTFTSYHNARYSRTVVDRETRRVRVRNGRSSRSRCTITFA